LAHLYLRSKAPFQRIKSAGPFQEQFAFQILHGCGIWAEGSKGVRERARLPRRPFNNTHSHAGVLKILLRYKFAPRSLVQVYIHVNQRAAINLPLFILPLIAPLFLID